MTTYSIFNIKDIQYPSSGPGIGHFVAFGGMNDSWSIAGSDTTYSFTSDVITPLDTTGFRYTHIAYRDVDGRDFSADSYFVGLAVTGAQWTLFNDISNDGTIVGSYVGDDGLSHAFWGSLDGASNFDAFNFFNDPPYVNYASYFTGISPVKDYKVGYYVDSSGARHSFWSNGTAAATLDVPNAKGTTGEKINDSGDIVGDYQDASGQTHGFQYKGGVYSDISYAGASATHATGINDLGEIVGYYEDSSGSHGFVDNGGVLSAFSGGIPTDIDSAGNILATYHDGSGALHAFIGMPNPDQAPVVTNHPAGQIYTPGQPVALTAGVDISDPDLDPLFGGNGDYSGVSVTIARHGGPVSTDTFFVVPDSQFVGGGTSGPLYYLSGGIPEFFGFLQSDAPGSLKIVFGSGNAVPTKALVEDVLHHVEFVNTTATAVPMTFDVTVNDGNTGAQGTGGALSSTATIRAQVGIAVDGYISGATVFIDENGNGVLDPGETFGTTDANGQFGLIGDGPLVLTGGTDTSTGLPLKVTLTAPSDSSVISPLTTVMVSVLKTGLAGAQQVATAFGIRNIAALQTDPIAGILAGDPDSKAAYLAGAQVMDTVVMIASAVAGTGAQFGAGANATFSSIAALVLQGGVVDLTNAAAVARVLLTAAPTLNSRFSSDLADLIAAKNRSISVLSNESGSTLVQDVALVEQAVQGNVSAVLAAVRGDPAALEASPIWVHTVRGDDFNGDATGDILLYNSNNSQVGEWLMKNGHISQGQAFGSLGVSSGWSIVGSGDFNGDGTSDVLLYNSNTSQLGEWLMQNGQLSQGKGFGSLGVGSGWATAGTGDFNGDGTADVLLYNTNNTQVGEWLMQNGQLSQGKGFGTLGAGSGWAIAGTGDFNGDGTTDVLLYNSNNSQVGEWLMQNGQLSQGQAFGTLGVSSGWSIAGTGDFNGDGTTDILLYNSNTSQIGVWLMQNGQLTVGANIGALGVGSGWSIAGTGDFNGDGTSDILLHNSTNTQVGEWLMQNGQLAQGQGFGTLGAGSGWQLKQV
jgi:probable HAF family extracellular repeat protein